MNIYNNMDSLNEYAENALRINSFTFERMTNAFKIFK